jgi:hypothetical protein
VAALIEEDDMALAQAASSKAATASKKKKKKGPAPKKAIVVEKEPSEEEEEEEEAAAAAAGSEGGEAAGQEGEEALPMPHIDPRFLQDLEFESEPEYRTAGKHSSSARAAAGHSDSAAKTAKAAESALSRPPGKPGSKDQKPPAARTAGDQHTQQQQQQQGKPARRDSHHTSSGSKLGPFINVLGKAWMGPGPLGDTAFFGNVVCVRCGQSDHPVQDCHTPHCSKCDKFGHPTDACHKACLTCGWPHPGTACRKPCSRCGMPGHHAGVCFKQQCFECKRYGHLAVNCSICRRCQQPGHKAADCRARECPECRQFGKGCVVGRCVSEQAAAAASSSSSRAAVPRQQQPGGGRAAVPLPQHVELLDAQAVQELGVGAPDALANKLMGRGLEDFAMGLLGTDKLNDLLRVKPEDLEVWLQQKDAQRYLQGLLDHLENSRKQQPQKQQQQQRAGQQQQATVRAEQLPPAVAEWFEQQFPEVQLPPEWRSWSWNRVESQLERVRGPHRVVLNRIRDAKKQAIADALAAGVEGSTGDSRRDSSNSSSAAANRQPSPPRQQQQRAAGEGAAGGSGPRDRTASHDSTGGMHFDEAASHADRHGSMQRQQAAAGPAAGKAGFPAAPPAGTAAAAAGGVRTVPGSAMEAVLQQKQKQLAAASQQQQQGPPGFGPSGPEPQQVGPSNASNSYATPNQQLSQQQQQQAYDQAVQQHKARLQAANSQIQDTNFPMEPWMLWLKTGAIRALWTMAPPGPEQAQLLRVLEESARDTIYTNMEVLNDALLRVLGGMRNTPQQGAWRNLGVLIHEANSEGLRDDLRAPQQQPPAAAAAPAAPAAAAQFMPPHLRTGGMAHLPPNMLGGQPGMGAAAGQPPLQQQQAAADDGDESSDDMDDMLGMLGVETAAVPAAPPAPAPAAAVAQPHATSWEQVTGQPLEADASTAEFPPLGGHHQPGEDADMQQALAASRADVAAISAASRGIKTVPGVSAAGLANQTGEYNCFLNVVVQCLWSCKAFTQEVRQLSMYDPHPVVEALLKLFGQMEEAEMGWQPGRER